MTSAIATPLLSPLVCVGFRLQHIVGSAASRPGDRFRRSRCVHPATGNRRPVGMGFGATSSAASSARRPVHGLRCTGAGPFEVLARRTRRRRRRLRRSTGLRATETSQARTSNWSGGRHRQRANYRNWMDRSTSWSPTRRTSPTGLRSNPKSRSMIRRMHCSVGRTGWWSSTLSSRWRAAGSSPAVAAPSSTTTPHRRPLSKRSPRSASSPT